MKSLINYKHLLLLLSPFVCAPLLAQQTYPLSVDELFSKGEANSLRIKESQIQQTIAAEREKTALTHRLPEINVGATGGYVGETTVFQQGLSRPTHPETPNWSQNYNIQLTQPLYNGGRIRNNIRQANLQKQIAALNLTTDKAELKLLLLRQYLNLIGYYKQKEVFARNVEESEVRLKDIRRMRKEGIVTRNDELRSELQLTNDKLNVEEAENSIAITSQQLNLILGLEESLLLQPDTLVLSTVAHVSDYEDYIRQASIHYPELQIARTNIEMAQNNVLLSKADNLPSLSLKAGNTLARPLSSSMTDVFANNWNIMLNLSYPLSSLYQNKHKIREAKQTVCLYQTMEEQVTQDVRIHVNSAYIRHREALRRVEALTLSVKQAEENYRIVRNRYLNQLSILTDLLDASNVRLEADLQLTKARTETLYTYYELQRSCGNL